jgi:hypothetical protein
MERIATPPPSPPMMTPQTPPLQMDARMQTFETWNR